MLEMLATIESMGKKRTKSGGEEPKSGKQNRSPNYTVFARIPPELGAAFEAYINSLRPKPTTTSVIQTFIEDGLERVGFWPPKGGAE